MQCKFCKAEMEADRKYCPTCGKRQDAPVKIAKQKPSKKKIPKTPTWQIVLAVVLSAAVIGLLIYLFVSGDSDLGRKNPSATTEPTRQVGVKPDYAAQADVVVGEFMGEKLTNGMLQLFYSDYLTEMYSNYGSSFSSAGLDVSYSLDKQTCPFEGVETWGEYFLNVALEDWKYCVLMNKLAEEDGYTLDEEWTKTVEEQMAALDKIAEEGNYSSAEAMIKTYYGDACSLALYNEYLLLDAMTNAYYYHILDVSDEQIDTAFEKYKEELAQKGITTESGVVSSVRHVLIYPEGGTTSEDGKTTVYSEDEWAACLAKAEEVLEEWKSGDAKEESFKDLVKKYSGDEASVADGGLYSEISRESNYVDEFKAWATDVARQEGETGLVRTQYGYHIMYYVSGEPEWKYYGRGKAQEDVIAVRNERIDKALEENPPEIAEDKILMQNVYQVYY